ncbi:aKG-HExxH-type peptide beta-hydroxylase [Sorangium sp. So ce385]|uniref:aKG-HExxH-type peptide beta-hydroxylase n=1 Tax=Sorangium sp. So ce385 TaxID=3133308 RepID=UPI003F5C65C5
MAHQTARAFFEERFEAGRRLLAGQAAEQLEQAAPELFVSVVRAGGAGLHEPLLRAWLLHESPAIGLDQILFGYLDEGDRPARLAVRANHRGVVHLPNLGSLRTGLPDGTFELRSPGGGAPTTLWRDGQPVNVVFTPRCVVPGTSIELHTDMHPFFPPFFRHMPSDEEVEIEETARLSLPALTRGFALLERVSPGQRAQVERDCRALVVLRSKKINSFATTGMLGAAFLSVPDEPTELFFCEDLVHQVGHLSFFAVTAEPCFTIPEDTLLSAFTVVKDDHRTLFAAFHGNYTIMCMVQFFDACVDDGELDARLRHELLGRFALAMERFGAGLESIDDERLYTPEAWAMHCRMVEVHDDVLARRRALLAGHDLSNQPYAFDYGMFSALNPAPPVAERPVEQRP